MKLTVQEDSKAVETEIIIHCSQIDGRMERFIKFVKQFTHTVQGKTETGTCFISAEEIVYADSVDSRTFLYSQDQVYGYSESLMELEKKLADSAFVRISKNCILNVSHLKYVNPLWNHRLEAVLGNGEKLIVTRHYIQSLKDKIVD